MGEEFCPLLYMHLNGYVWTLGSRCGLLGETRSKNIECWYDMRTFAYGNTDMHVLVLTYEHEYKHMGSILFIDSISS